MNAPMSGPGTAALADAPSAAALKLRGYVDVSQEELSENSKNLSDRARLAPSQCESQQKTHFRFGRGRRDRAPFSNFN